ncbi:MAG: tetratricopeptide repeat protein [Candidatus Promineifilaceae bacterium]
MTASRTQLKELDKVLRATYDRVALRRMLRFELDRALNDISLADDFKTIVFELIETAEREGWLDDLVMAMIDDQPTNGVLQALADGWVRTRSAEPSRDIPLELPERRLIIHFTGREQELAQLQSELRAGCFLTLTGAGGMGKTTLVAKLLWTLHKTGELLQRFPDGVVFHTFYEQPTIAEAQAHILRAFGKRDSLDAQVLKTLLMQKRALLVLDGAEDADDLPRLLDRVGNSGVLITSRKRDDAPEGLLPITPMDAAVGVELLQKWIGKDAPTEPLAQIVALTGGLPLALRLAGRNIREQDENPAQFAQWLAESPLQQLDKGKRRIDSVPLLLERSVAQLKPAAQALVPLIGCLALAPFDVKLIAAGIGGSVQEARAQLADLTRYGLLIRTDEGAFQVVHALIHHFARVERSLDNDPLLRLADYLNQFIREKRDLGLAGYQQIHPVRPHAMALLGRLENVKQWKGIVQLVWALQNYLGIQGFSVQRVRCLVLAVYAARESAYRQNEGAHLGNLGLAYSALGEVQEAIKYHKEALEIAREIGDRRGEGNQLGNLGNAYSALGEVEEAVKYYKEVLEIAREIGDRRGEGADLGNLGVAYSALGEVEEAIKYYKEALEIAREIGDRRNEGNQLGNLGIAYKKLGEIERVRPLWLQAIEIFAAIQSPTEKVVRSWLEKLDASDS